MARENDYYSLLGVSPDAEADQIRKAFRERVRACHPDRVANLDEDLRRLAEEKMVELNEAYAVLRNAARRAAYDHRNSHRAAASRATAATAARTTAATVSGRPLSGSPADGAPLVDPAVARNRIGEQGFVARAAAEEFQLTIQRCLSGRPTWTPIAFPGATLALCGARGRTNFNFVLLAAARVDDKGLRRFLRSLDSSSGALPARMFGNNLLFGFVGAVEFMDQRRQRATLDRFNEGRSGRGIVRPATLVDLVNWHVVPGEITLQARLENLLQGS